LDHQKVPFADFDPYLKKEYIRKLEALEIWLWRRMEKMSWTDKVTNDEVLEIEQLNMIYFEYDLFHVLQYCANIYIQ
jgi:hypothetical protein